MAFTGFIKAIRSFFACDLRANPGSGYCFRLLVSALLGFFVISCGNSGPDDNLSARSVTGRITYKRLPIKVDADGYPIGLDTPDKAEALPLRGISVRVVYPAQETMPDGSKVDVWRATDLATTDSRGDYGINLPDDETLPVYVEVPSAFSYSLNNLRTTVRLIADPDGINSKTPHADRVLYSIRRGLDGSSPDDNPTPAVAVKGKVTLDIEIGLDDKWWIGHPYAGYAPDAVIETNGTGSRIAAIMDTFYKAVISFGNPTPSDDDNNLDVHYRRGVTEPLGTYVEYDTERFPLAYNAANGKMRYFGSVRGGPQFDDAWDEGVLLSMMARNSLRSSGVPFRFRLPARKFPGFDTRNRSITINLQPTTAMAEGLPDAIAAVALKTPFLTSASGTIVKDIRNAGLPLDIYSAPAISAFTWELALKANGIDSPGNPAAWDDIDPTSIIPFYSLKNESKDNENELPEIIDLPSIFTQLARLSESEGINNPLAEIFTDTVITQMTTPFFGGTIWPRPTEGPLSGFITDWGIDPDSANSPLPSFVFSMSDAVLDAEGKFTNLTSKESSTAKIILTKDKAYWLSVTTVPPLPNGASIEVRVGVNENILSSYLFYTFSSSLPNPQRVVLPGNSDIPFYLLDFRLKSPVSRVPETRVNVRLDPAY